MAPSGLSVACFRRDICSYVQAISSLIPFNQLGLPKSLLANSNTRPDGLFTINRQTNTPGGKLEGFEINGQFQVRFLPGFLSRTGALANYTRLKCRINYILASVNGVPSQTTEDDLVGLSRDAASASEITPRRWRGLFCETASWAR
jgi:hypothetical protein